MIFIHVVPFVTSTFNFILTDAKFRLFDTIMIVIIGEGIMVVNATGTKFLGFIYPLLEWQGNPIDTNILWQLCITTMAGYHFLITYISKYITKVTFP